MNSNKNRKNEAEVLFQKLGNTWYAFSEIKDDVIYSALPAGTDPRETSFEFHQIIEDHLQKVAATKKAARKPEVAA